MPGSIWDMSKMQPFDLTGILVKQTVVTGMYNNYPTRRRTVPYEPIDLYANNNRTLRVYVKTNSLDIVDVTGAVAVLSVAIGKGETPVFQKHTNVAGEGAIGDALKGELLFYIKPNDTMNLDIRQYVYDVRLTLDGSATYTVLEGVINLLQTVG